MTETAGYAVLQVIPSVRGIGAGMERQLNRTAASAGVRSGEQMGRGIIASAATAVGRGGAAITRSVVSVAGRAGAAIGRSVSTAVGRGMSVAGAAAERGLRPALVAAQNLAAGFGSTAAAASTLTGRMGSLGGLARAALSPAIVGAQNVAAGFMSSQAAASAFTGRLGTVGGLARSVVQPVANGIGRFRDGFTNSAAAASVFSGRMGSLGGVARRAFDGVRSGASAAAGAFRNSFANAANQAQSGVGALGGSLSRMGAVGAAAVGAIGLGALGKSAFGVATDIQQTTASMAGLYGSTSKAEGMMRKLRDYSRSTPLETQSLYEAGKNLAYLGLEGDGAMKVVKNVGVALQASGNVSSGAMTNVTSALLNMQSAGQLYAADIQRVSSEMVPAWDMLSAHMGMSIKDVRAEVSAGKLTVDDFVAALSAGDGDYFAMMRQSADQTSQTFKSQFLTIKDNILTTLGETLLPQVNKATPALARLGGAVNSGLQGIPGVLSSLKSTLDSSGLTSAFTSLGQGVRSVATAAGPFVTAFASTFATAIGGVLLVVGPLGTALSSLGSWMSNNTGVVQVLGAALGGAAAAFVVLNAGMAIARTGLAAYRTVAFLVTTLTKGWTVAQWSLNTALTANPLGLIVLAAAAVAAGVYMAYQRFEGFRNVVNTVAGAVKVAGMWIWDNGLRPAFEGIKTGVSAIGTAAMWLWTNAIGPAFRFISAAAKILITAIVVVLVLPIIAQFKAVARIATWLWNVAIGPAFRGIGALAKWLWTAAIAPAIRAIGGVFRWLYTTIVRPVFALIRSVISVWWTGVRAIFSAVRTYILGPLGAGFRWFYNSVIRPVWSGIRSVISTVWNSGIKPIFTRVGEAVRAMARAFGRGKDAIGKAWRGIRDAGKKPINFVINTIYNKGILPVWNKVAGIVGAKELKEVKAFRTGGPVYGAGTATSDSIPSLLSNNEHVWTAREVQAAGGHGTVEALRQQALAGGNTYSRGGAVFPAPPTIPSAKSVLDAVKDFVSPSGIFGLGSDLITGNYKKAVDKFFTPAKAVTKLIGTKGIPGVPYQIVNTTASKIKTKISEMIEAWNASFGGGGGSAAWVGFASASKRLQNAARFADKQHGKNYQWGGVGNPSFDCSGFTGSIERVIRGLHYVGRLYTTHSFAGTPPSGWVKNLKSPYMVGVKHGGRGGGHTAGTLLGKNVESGSRGVVTGPSAQGARNFPHVYGFKPVVGEVGNSTRGRGGDAAYDAGGWLETGITRVHNNTGSPEAVFTRTQWDRLERLIDAVERGRGGDGLSLTVNAPGRQDAVDDVATGVVSGLRKARLNGLYTRAGR